MESTYHRMAYLTMSMHHDAFFANSVSGTTSRSISSVDRVPDRYDRNGAVGIELLDDDPGIAVKMVDFFVWLIPTSDMSLGLLPSSSSSKRLPRTATQ